MVHSLYLAAASLFCCIVSSVGFAPVRTRSSVDSIFARSSNQPLHLKYLHEPSTIINNENPAKEIFSSIVHKNKVAALAILFAGMGLAYPSPCFAASSILSHIPSPSDFKQAVVSILDGMSQSGTKGMVTYVLSFTAWTMTVGVTTPVETAAGMAFPLRQSIPLSAFGKIGGAFFQYMLAKYLFSDYAREKMKDNKWMGKIEKSFKSHPFGVALIWRFSPLPEFVKNVGPSLVKTLKTRYQLFAILAHGLPFTVLWSCMGAEAAAVARGGEASVLLKRMVAGISWVGLFVSPTLFGMWLKGLGDDTKSDEAI
ncbi:hypothetical protein ACHAXM_008453 [Skeletonema potamos]|jgi:uncharacterized membrane protein YdjX (TVP38/TMEM64 family)